jgi:TonB-dependent receptor
MDEAIMIAKRKSLSRIILFMAWMVLALVNSGGAVDYGTIQGTVRDASTGEPLPGANVILVGTSLGAAADADGKFIILRVSPGTYTLRVTFIGYRPVEVTVTVQPGQKVVKDVALQFMSLKGKEVIITAQAEGQVKAINQQLTSTSIVNVVSSARIQELPDANAAESVARLPGISVIRSGGEGTKVVIRGLAPKYNQIMIDGVKMASTDFDDRSVDLSMISPYSLEGIEVLKAITADKDADHIGGSVNFMLREAPSGFHYDLISQGGYNHLKGAYNDYLLVGNVSRRFLDEKLGVFFQANVERRNRSAHEMGASYYLKGPKLGEKNPVYISGLNLTDITRTRSRTGGTLVLDYKIPFGKIAMKNFFSTGETSTQRRGETYGLNNSTHTYVGGDARNKLTVMTNILSYEQQFAFGKLDARISHSYSENDAPKNIEFVFTETAAFEEVNTKAPPTEVPKYARNDLSRTYLASIGEFRRNSKDRELTASANLESVFRFGRWLSGKIKFGGKYRLKKREHDYWWAGGPLNLGSGQGTRNAILNAFPWMKETVPTGAGNLPYTLFIDPKYDPGEFLNGEYTLGPTPNIDLMNKVMDVVRQVNELEAYHPNQYLCTTYDYNGNEVLTAGYIMATLNIGQKIDFIPGVRYERNRTEYTAPQGNSSFTGSDINYRHIDTTTTRVNEHWLPMIHLRLKPFRWFDIRLAYTNTLSRPDFRRIVPRYNITQTSVSWNNYRLKPERSENYDLYFSFHGNYIGLFTVGFFKKNIRDMIFSTGRRVILDPAEYGLPESEKDKFIYTSINNPYTAYVKGLELDWQTNFWYLPGYLRGLVLHFNYTWIRSEAKYPRTELRIEYLTEYPYIRKTVVDTFYTDRLLDQPDNIMNLSLGYDYKGFSIRLSMLYQSNIFHGTNFWPELRRITDDYLRWDLSVKQNLPWSGLQLFCNVNNITGALDRDLNQGSNFPAAEQHYGMSVDFGIRLRL